MGETARATAKLTNKKIIAFGALAAILNTFLFEVPVASKVFSASTTIIINEVMYDPQGSDEGLEWIELKNVSDDPINIQGWKIQAAGTTYIDKAVLPNFILSSGELLVIGEPNTPYANITVPSLAFQNGGTETDGIRIVDLSNHIIDTLLYDSPNANNLVDDTGVPGVSFASDVISGHTLSRKRNTDTDKSDQDFVDTLTPTPGEENLFSPISQFTIQTPTYKSTPIILDGSNSGDVDGEIIAWSWTITNPTGHLASLAGETPSFTFDTIGSWQIKLDITDSDDLVGTHTETISVIEDPNNPTILPIKEARQLPLASPVTIEGTITSPIPCILATETYAQDATGGIRIKVEAGQDIEFGKSYRLFGKIDQVYGEKRLSVTLVSEINRQILIKPQIIQADQFSPTTIGKLIQLEAQIVGSKDNYLYLKSNQGHEVKVYFSKYSELVRPSGLNGKFLTVTGIVSQYGLDDKGNPKIRIIPRFEDDLEYSIKPHLMAQTGSPQPLLVISTIVFLSYLSARKLDSNILF